jgi:hypothetical protein
VTNVRDNAAVAAAAECKCDRCQDHIADKPGRSIGQRYIDALVKADHYSLMFRMARGSGELDECSRPRGL